VPERNSRPSKAPQAQPERLPASAAPFAGLVRSPRVSQRDMSATDLPWAEVVNLRFINLSHNRFGSYWDGPLGLRASQGFANAMGNDRLRRGRLIRPHVGAVLLGGHRRRGLWLDFVLTTCRRSCS
jgi:hypothetical protein